MLLNGIEYNGKRILARKTTEYLTSNHLSADLILFNQESTGEGYALTMSVTVDPEQTIFMSSLGNYGWGGAASTYFRIDYLDSNGAIYPIGFHRYHDDFRNLVYQALEN